MRQLYLSVIIPFYNEKGNLPKLHRKILTELKKIRKPTEIIYLDDGSTDESLEVLEKTVRKYKTREISVKIIALSRNFGQTSATAAGIDHAEGSLLAFLDADLQNDSADLHTFLKEIEKGYDAVFGWRKNRNDNTRRVFLSQMANTIIRYVFKVPLHDVGCSLKIVKEELLRGMKFYGESHRIMPVLIYWKGAKIKELVVHHYPRRYGSSKYGYSRIFKLVIDLITAKFLNSYGTKPAYIFGTIGLGSVILAGFTFLAVTYRKLVQGAFVHNDPLFIVAIFFTFIGIQFLLMGLLAELLVRTYFESQKKTTYEIKSITKM